MPILTSFSTERYSPSERQMAWREHINENLFEADMSSFASEGLLAERHSRSYEDMIISRYALNEHTITRNIEMTERNPHDSLFVSILLQGGAVYYSPGVTREVGVGQILLYDSRKPYVLAWHPQTVQLHADVPRELYLALSGSDAFETAETLRTEDGLRRGVGSLAELRSLANDFAVQRSQDAQARAHSCVIDLLTALDRRKHSGLYFEARQQIELHCSDPDLAPESLARSLAVSPRHLARVFAEHGTTTKAEIARCRVAGAQRAIAETSDSLIDIAVQNGFGTRQTMLRTFARLGLRSPSGYRS
ncbi:MAG: helix-turn-helix domain-containing protein [Leucobacter sp.]